MASISGASSGSSQMMLSSGSDQDPSNIMEQRKRKRMISNRESARRSRMKKQQHLDELSTQVSKLRLENEYIFKNLNGATHMYLQAEAENSVLRAQLDELNYRLNSLNDIGEFMYLGDGEIGVATTNSDDIFNPWNLMHLNEPIMVHADMFMF